MKKPLVSIIIVNWNGAELLYNCLSNILKQDYKNIEVIVVDNKSVDNSEAIIKKFKQVILIKSNTNLGFAGGNNLGVKSANGKYILLLNTDTTVSKDFLLNLVATMENNAGVGVLQPKVLFENKTINSIGAYLINTGFLYYPGYGKKSTGKEYLKKREVYSAYGACMLIRKQIIDEIGLFDDDYFMYFEETDFCIKVWLSGSTVICDPAVSILHKGGVSSNKFGLERIYFHSFKNRICTYLKTMEVVSLIQILPLHIAICIGLSFIYLVTGKLSYFFAIQKAIFWNIWHIPATYNKRRIIIRRVREKDYIATISKTPRLSYYLYLFKGLQYYKD